MIDVFVHRRKNEVIEIRNSNFDLNDPDKDIKDDLETRLPKVIRKNLKLARCSVTKIGGILFLDNYSPAFASSSSLAISPLTSENATSFRPLFVTTSA